MKKSILAVGLIGLGVALPIYLTGNTDSGLNVASAAEEQGNNFGGNGMFLFKPKCREAVRYAKDCLKWEDSYTSGAKTASLMFDRCLPPEYSSMRFVTTPVPPYFFLTAHLERELSSTRVVNIEKGVIERKDEGALEAFLKYINILDTKDTPKHLAEMIHCFHVGGPWRLVTEHKDEEWRAEQNEPRFTKNEDGSVTLIYDMIHTGRSNAVNQFTLTVTPDYKVTLTDVEKQKNKKTSEK